MGKVWLAVGAYQEDEHEARHSQQHTERLEKCKGHVQLYIICIHTGGVNYVHVYRQGTLSIHLIMTAYVDKRMMFTHVQ